MKKSHLFFVILGFLVFSLAGVSYGWQGRMGGMGDPYGLVQDESDFLFHPAGIANGKGINFYGDYRFNYTGVADWNYNLTRFDSSGVFQFNNNFDTSGKEYRHDALLGAAFPLGPGRMGAFFTYKNKKGEYDGDRTPSPAEYDMDSDLEDFSFRLIYGFPIHTLRGGLELGVAYRDEEKKWWIPSTKNDVWPSDYSQNLHFFMNPNNSKYWEIFWKVGVGGKLNAASFDWTIRGGNIISAKNKYEYSYSTGEHVVMDGDITGFSIGSDLWVRYQMNDSLTLPFVLSVDYTRKHRNGDGIGTAALDLGDPYTYEHREKKFEFKVGGGLEKKINTGGLIGAALYYNYLQGREDQWFNNLQGSFYSYFYDYEGFPLHKEHRVEMKFAGEKQLSAATSLRLGLGFFYGWVVAHDFKQSSVGVFTDDISLDGYTWGINASVGGTVKFSRLTLEPFINGGYRRLKLDGDGDVRNGAGTITGLWDMDQKRAEWSIGGGLSIKF